MSNPHMLAHAFEPGAHKLTRPAAAHDLWDVKDCQPMPVHGLGDVLCLEAHSMLVFLVPLLGLLTRNRHNIPAMSVHGRNKTIIFFPLNRDLGHGKHVHGNRAHRFLGDRRINRVPRCGVVRAFRGPTHGTIVAIRI